MAVIDSFDKIVTTTKRNNIYYGATKSRQMASFLEEVRVDLGTIYDEVNLMNSAIDILASGYLQASGSIEVSGCLFNISDLKSKLSHLEDQVNRRIYIQSEQNAVFE